MKSQQLNEDALYRPSSLWQKHIDFDFKYLNESLKENDLKKFLFFYKILEIGEIILELKIKILLKDVLKIFY